MRDLAFLAGVFLAAVLIGLLLHPLASIMFLILAKVVSILWADGAAAYRAEMARDRVKAKRRHIVTDDGERLDVIADEDMKPPGRLQR